MFEFIEKSMSGSLKDPEKNFENVNNRTMFYVVALFMTSLLGVLYDYYFCGCHHGNILNNCAIYTGLIFFGLVFIGVIVIEGIIRVKINNENALKASERNYRLLAEKSARAEKFFSTIFNSISEGLVVLDREKRIVYANQSYLAMYGKSLGDVTGKYCFEISHSSEIDCEQLGEECPVTKTFQTFENAEVCHFHKLADGKVANIKIRSFPLKCHECEAPEYVIETSADITEEVILREKMMMAEKMQMLGNLAGGIAHDFNNVTTSIVGYSELIRNKYAYDKNLMKYIENIIKAGIKAQTITKELLSLGRNTSEGKEIVGIDGLLEECVRIVKSSLKGIDFKIISVDSEISVYANRTELERVFINLAINARDAMCQSGSLYITVSKKEFDEVDRMVGGKGTPFVLVEFKDTGHGIKQEDLLRIWEPFYTTKGKNLGTGLGLSVVKNIIEGMGGFINVESAPGKGANFKVYIPIESTEKENLSLYNSKNSETILVVDDEIMIREILADRFKSFGYKVIQAVNGKDAVKKFREKDAEISLIIFDIIMPEMNGPEAFEEISRIRPGIKVIYMSGYMENKNLIAQGHLLVPKPISPLSLIKIARKVLDE